MLKTDTDLVTEHAFASRPLDWPLMRKGVAYWMANDSNVSKFPRFWDFFICDALRVLVASVQFKKCEKHQ